MNQSALRYLWSVWAAAGMVWLGGCGDSSQPPPSGQDTEPPSLVLKSPLEGSISNQARQRVELEYTDASGIDPSRVKLRVNGDEVTASLSLSSTGATGEITLPDGVHTLVVQVADTAGNEAQVQAGFMVDGTPPALSFPSWVEGSTLTDGPQTVVLAYTDGLSGVIPSTLRLQANGQDLSPQLTAGESEARGTLSLAMGLTTLVARVQDKAGNEAQATLRVIALPEFEGLITPLDDTVAVPLADAVAFLHTGPRTIQMGVAPGTINLKRVAVLRGQVTGQDGSPLAGVKVSVQGRPEYGQTFTRPDGMFDLAVNGGALLTLEYERAGLLPAQRQVQAPLQDYVWLPEVMLVALDSQVTAIALDGSSSQVQIARGSPVTDSDGTRQATVLFPPSTQVSMVLPDGSTQPLTTLHVRATEYTVGAAGPRAMPGELPATSGYTYAVELSVDEALQAGAKEVRFSQPLPVYVDNFPGFPVGGIVPAGWYDREKAAWVPSGNGRVVKVLGIQEGLALLDTNGDEAADDASQLAALGVTEAERARVAQLYPAGHTAWRVQLNHFTPIDLNWPVSPPADARAPNQPAPLANDDRSKPDVTCGSIIGVQNQTLGERVGIAGTPFSLHYQSDRVPGRAQNKLIIPLSGESVPASLKRISLDIQIEGRRFHYTFPASPNLSHDFEWDGKDAYGRPLQGSRLASIDIGYVYGAVFRTPAEAASSFAAFGGTPVTGNRSTSEVTLHQRHQARVRVPDSRVFRLAGWTLSEHHAYDPASRTLHLGDGTWRSAQGISPVISTLFRYTPIGEFPNYIAWGPDGTAYLLLTSSVARLNPDGTITYVANDGRYSGFAGDGGPAIQALFYNPRRIELGPDGSIYIADVGNHRIRKVTPDGIINTVAGCGSSCPQGDGGPATQALLAAPADIALAPDGSLYIVDEAQHNVRKVTPDGIITTVAGSGTAGFSGDGGPATQARLFYPEEIELGPDGSLYIMDTRNFRIRKVGPDGIITTVAGNGQDSFSGNGGPATAAGIGYPDGMARGLDGSLYFLSSLRVRRVSPNGIITTVAGNGSLNRSGDGGPAAQAGLGLYVDAVAVSPEGLIHIVDGFVIRKISPPLPGFAGAASLIPSEDGTEVYQFDAAGRHLTTRDARTGGVIYTFGYSNRLLTQVQDGDGNVTRIERDATGNALAIVAPDGQRTALTLDANGWLASLADPTGAAYRMEYTASGLLTRFTNPRGHSTTLQYDSNGLLLQDANAASGSWSFTRTAQPLGRLVTQTSAEGRTSTYRIEDLATGDERRTGTASDGTTTTELIGDDGVTVQTGQDGTVVTNTQGPDPRFGMQAPLDSSTQVRLPSGLTSSAATTRVVSVADPYDPLSLTQETTTLTLNGREFSIAYTAATRQYTSTTPENRTSTFRVDAQGRPTLIQSPGAAALNYQYDTRGRFTTVTQGTGADARALALTYGADGYVQSVTDAANQQVIYQRDGAGRVTQASLPGNRVLRFGHDANGNLTSLTPPERPAHTFTYSPVDLQSEYVPPSAGLPQAGTGYQYNLDQQLTTVARPDGVTVSLGYQPNGRMASMTPSANGEAITYGYQAATGRLNSIATPTVALSYTWDGFLPKQESYSGALAGTVSRTYDNNFRVTGVAVNGTNVTLAYDRDSLLTRVGTLTISRDAATGFITGTTLGNVATAQGYNGFGELASFTAAVSGSPQLGYTLGYDRLGRITTRAETIAGTTTTWEYGFDLAGRLATVAENGTVVRRYGYDANGNRTHLNGALIASYDDQDRMLTYGAATYEYGANGELQRKTAGGQATQYRYDVFGNLKEVVLPDGTRIEYLTDGLHRRIGKKVNGTVTQKFLYQDPLKIVAELDASNTVVSRFHYGTRVNVPEYMTRGGVTYRLITDHLGSVRLVIDTATGAIAQRLDYDEWGNVTSDTSPGFQPFGFAGGLQDNHTRLVRFGARDYDPAAGRWTAKDPIGLQGGWNTFSYVENEPLTQIDPLGLWSWEVSVRLVSGVSLAFGRDPKTDRPFVSAKVGLGIGGGFQWDPNGGRPGKEDGNPCEPGISIGAYADGEIARWLLSQKTEFSGGFLFQPGQFSVYDPFGPVDSKTTVSSDGLRGFKPGASAGFELAISF